MRRLLTAAALFGLFVGAAAVPPVSPAQAQECTGENCPPPAGGQGGKRDCERGEAATS